MGNLALPKGRRSFTPYDVETLGLRYDHEPDWLLSSRSILQLVKNRFEQGGFDAA